MIFKFIFNVMKRIFKKNLLLKKKLNCNIFIFWKLELVIYDVVKVDVQLSEDIWVVKMFNLYLVVSIFLYGGNVVREVLVFGVLFNENILVVGFIDELCFDFLNYIIDLNELKICQYFNLLFYV